MTRTRPAAEDVDRRTVLKTLGVATLGSLAGCSGSAPSDGSGGEGADSGGGDETDAPQGTGTPTETEGDSGSTEDSDSGAESGSDADSGADGGSTASFGDWFDGVSNFDGVVDRTGQSEVEVAVGAQGNGGYYAFDPAAVRVSPGTTVVWRWTGQGGTHNVAAEDGSFESELVSEEGHTFSHTFEESGTVRYVCTPHRTLGMKGAVVVE